MFLSLLAITAAPVPTVMQKNHTMCANVADVVWTDSQRAAILSFSAGGPAAMQASATTCQKTCLTYALFHREYDNKDFCCHYTAGECDISAPIDTAHVAYKQSDQHVSFIFHSAGPTARSIAAPQLAEAAADLDPDAVLHGLDGSLDCPVSVHN